MDARMLRQCKSYDSALRPSSLRWKAFSHSTCQRPAKQRTSGKPLRCQAIFNFGKSEPKEKKYASSMTREEYTSMDVEDYFNYMGMLAAEGNYDRMEKMLETGVAPADLLLLMAASENDAPKVAELLRAGADISAKDMNGKRAEELTEDAEVLMLLEDRQKAFTF